MGSRPELRERSATFWERLNDERPRYASVLRRAVTQLAEEGDVVIVGLGGGQLLPGWTAVTRGVVPTAWPSTSTCASAGQLSARSGTPPATGGAAQASRTSVTRCRCFVLARMRQTRDWTAEHDPLRRATVL